MKNFVLILAIFIFCGANAHAEVIFYDDFTGGLTWTTSDSSVYIKDNDYLYISSDSGYDDWAERNFAINLTPDTPIIIKQRIKLDSGGLNYRLPGEEIFFEDSSKIGICYLPSDPGQTYGWYFGFGNEGYSGIEEPAVIGEDYWVVTKLVITPTGGELYMRPDADDKVNGWYSEDFTFVTSTAWSHSQITKIRFDQPWDSANSIDYIKISAIPEPATLLLFGFGGLLLRRKRRA